MLPKGDAVPAYCQTVVKNTLKGTSTCPKPSATSAPKAAIIPSSIQESAEVNQPANVNRSAALRNISFLVPEEQVRSKPPTQTSSDPNSAQSTTADASTQQPPTPKTAAPSGPPCDVATLKDQKQTPCKASQTIQDEGLYHWDISIAVPTPGYRDTTVSGTNMITAKSVTRTDAFAMLDIAPWGEDFRSPPMFGIPHLMTGLPISGKVFDKPFIGGLGEEVGLSKILPFSARIFAGVVYPKEFRMVSGSTSLIPHRVWKVQYGVEFSISSVASQLKAGSGTSKSQKGDSTKSSN